MNRRPKILFVSSFLLFPETHAGGAKRLWYFAKELAKHADLWVIETDGCFERNKHGASIAHFERTLFIDTFRRRIHGALFPMGTSGSLHINRKALRSFLADTSFDGIFAAYPAALQLMNIPELARQGSFCYLEDDLYLELLRNQAFSKKTVLKKLYNNYKRHCISNYYNRMFNKVRTFISISEEERGIATRLWPATRTEVIPYGVPLEDYPLLPLPQNPAPIIGYIGNFTHSPNAIALAFIVNEIRPLVLKKYPSARFVIAGRNIPKNIINSVPESDSDNFEWLGEIDSVVSFYENITIFLNPVFSGRGLRTKLVEAAAFGRPIISTALGAEGLEKLDLLIAETADEFLVQINTASDRNTSLPHISKNRAAAEDHYSIAAISHRLLDILLK